MSELVESPKDSNQFVTIEPGKSELTPMMLRNSILGIEELMLKTPDTVKLALETMHNFTDGIYVRTVLMGAGSLITGKIHKKEHIVIISQGSASIVSEEFGSKRIQAPMIFVSPPGVKRLLFIHSDMIFTTVHQNPSNTRDLKILEDELIAPTYDDLQKEQV